VRDLQLPFFDKKVSIAICVYAETNTSIIVASSLTTREFEPKVVLLFIALLLYCFVAMSEELWYELRSLRDDLASYGHNYALPAEGACLEELEFTRALMQRRLSACLWSNLYEKLAESLVELLLAQKKISGTKQN
jgi:hypothetical protein